MCPFNVLKGFIITLIIFSLQKLIEAAPNSRQVENNNHIRSNGVRYPTRSVNQIQYSRARQEAFPDFLGKTDCGCPIHSNLGSLSDLSRIIYVEYIYRMLTFFHCIDDLLMFFRGRRRSIRHDKTSIGRLWTHEVWKKGF